MKRKYWWICVLFSIILITIFCTNIVENDIINCVSNNNVGNTKPTITPEALGDPMGTKGVWLQDVSGESITADGDLSDWGSTIHDVFNGVDVYIGYDSSDVYVGLAWVDSSRDGKLSEWNKTGSATLDNATHGTYDQLAGADDMLAVGFTNSSGYSDIWIWMESIRSDNAYAYEVNGSWVPDAGVLPYDENFDTTIEGWDQPDRYNNTNPIADHDGLVNGTAFIGWFESLTPTNSQTDVDMGYTWNASGDDRYVVEFIRPLDTGSQVDDILLDLGNATELGLMKFWVGSENKQDCFDFSVSTNKYNMEPPSETNVAAEFEWDTIANPVYEALLLQGAVYDDYVVEADDFTVTLSGWADTYGASYVSTIADDISLFTGDWSYLFYYDEDDMPIGDNTVNITWTPKYDVASYNTTAWQWANISDVAAPSILGLVDVNLQYPLGVPGDQLTVPITVGAGDNYQYYSADLGGYTDKDALTIYLFSWVDDDVALMNPMEQFSPGGTTFSVNLTLAPLAAGETHNVSYFVEVWDPSNNKATSVHCWFIHGDITPAITELGERVREFIDEHKWKFVGGGIFAAIIGTLSVSATAILGVVKSTVIGSCTKAITQQTLSGVTKIEPVTRILKTISKLTNGRVIRIISNRMFNILEKQLVLNTNQSRNISDILLNFVIKKVPHFKPRQFTRLKKLVDLPLNNYHSFILGGVLASSLAFDESIKAFEKAKINADDNTKQYVDTEIPLIKSKKATFNSAQKLSEITKSIVKELKKLRTISDNIPIPQVAIVNTNELNNNLSEKIQVLSVAEQGKLQLIEKSKMPNEYVPVDVIVLEFQLHLCRNRKLFFQLLQSLLLFEAKEDEFAEDYRSEEVFLEGLQSQFKELTKNYDALSKDERYKHNKIEAKLLQVQREQCDSLDKFIHRIKTDNIDDLSNYKIGLTNAKTIMDKTFRKKDLTTADFYVQRYSETQMYIDLYLNNPKIGLAPVVRSYFLIPFSESKVAQKYINATDFLRSFNMIEENMDIPSLFVVNWSYNYQIQMMVKEFPEYFPELDLSMEKLDTRKKYDYSEIKTDKSRFDMISKEEAELNAEGHLKFTEFIPDYTIQKFKFTGNFKSSKADNHNSKPLKDLEDMFPRPLKITGNNKLNVIVVERYGPKHHILYFSEHPEGVAQEFSDIQETLLKIVFKDKFVIIPHPVLLPEDFTGHFRDYFSVIVHFNGLSNKEGKYQIRHRYLNQFKIDDDALAEILGNLSDNVKCVVLNGCYREDLAKKIAKHINCVVGTPLDQKDDYRKVFATEFYQAIGNGKEIGIAINIAKSQINALKMGDPEHIKFEYKIDGISQKYCFILRKPKPIKDNMMRNEIKSQGNI